mgnify:CR=1 FL=1
MTPSADCSPKAFFWGVMDSEERRRYWCGQMDAAFRFMELMRGYPVQECGEPFVSLREVLDGVEVLFSETKINHTYPRVYYVREQLALSLRQVARAMNDRGWVLKIEDAYRSPEMQRAQSHNPRHFDRILEKVRWELGGELPTPELMLKRLSAIIATRCSVGTHVSGSAVDISVFDRTTGNELERGGRYVEISERTPMQSPFVTEEERRNRMEIAGLMQAYGWYAYPYEFWHFSQGDCYAEWLSGSGKPGRYGPVSWNGKEILPIDREEADRLLEPLAFYEREIQAALERATPP